MAAPKGNNYWEFRNKHGRDFAYTPELFWDEAVKYFNWMQDRVWNKKEAIKSGEMAGVLLDIPTSTPMSITSFCLFADIDENTFQRYEKEVGYEAFWAITKRVKGIIESQQFEGATIGVYNPNIIAKKLGLADKLDHTTNGKEITNTLPVINLNINSSKTDFASSEDEVDA